MGGREREFLLWLGRQDLHTLQEFETVTRGHIIK